MSENFISSLDKRISCCDNLFMTYNVNHQGFATAWFNCAKSVAPAQLNQAVANPLDGIVSCDSSE